MLYEAKVPSGGRRFAVVVVLGAIVVFALAYAVLRFRTSEARDDREAAAGNTYSEPVKTANGQDDGAASISRDPPSSAVAGDASPPNTPKIVEAIPSPESSGPHGALIAPDLQEGKQIASRRVKAIARAKPEEGTADGVEKRVKDVTLYEDVAVKAAKPHGYFMTDTSYIPIPDHCKYVNHQIDLLERRPWHEPEITWDPFTFYRPKIEVHSNGEVRSLSLTIIATARKEFPEGSLIKMRLSVDVHCENGYRGRIESLADDEEIPRPSG